MVKRLISSLHICVAGGGSDGPGWREDCCSASCWQCVSMETQLRTQVSKLELYCTSAWGKWLHTCTDVHRLARHHKEEWFARSYAFSSRSSHVSQFVLPPAVAFISCQTSGFGKLVLHIGGGQQWAAGTIGWFNSTTQTCNVEGHIVTSGL